MSTGRTFAYIIVFAGLAAAAWLLGLFLFVLDVEAMEEPAINPSIAETDAIVVLTGGSGRISTGIDLVNAHKARKLFISGVGPGLSLDHMKGHRRISKDLRACCIVLGHEAENTVGNAEETYKWMKEQHYHSLRLVTANYHMPRSLLIFRPRMPEIQIIPHPVMPDNLSFNDWWRRPYAASLLVTEYTKFLFALAYSWLGLE